MSHWTPVAVSLPFVSVLLASGAWADRYFSEFEKLPRHYNFSGEPTAYTSRTTMAWLTPGILTVTLLAIALLAVFGPPRWQTGDPLGGVLITGFGFLAAQAFILWLTKRWARSQRQ